MRFALTAAALVAGLLVSPLWASPAGAAVVTCDGHRATIVGTSGDDHLNGTSGNDVIAALGGADVVHGRGGNDIICGGVGADQLWGDSGNDQLFGGRDSVRLVNGVLNEVGDTLVGGTGDDRLVGGTDSRRDDSHCGQCLRDVISWKTSAHPVTINLAKGVASGDGSDRFARLGVQVEGSPFDDHIFGSDGADWISAGDGSDYIEGGAGDDRISTDVVGAVAQHGSADTVYAGPGNDTVSTYGGANIVHGGSGDDRINENIGSGSADKFYGEDGNDIILDQVITTTATQRLSGGAGVDELGVLVNSATVGDEHSYQGIWNMATGDMTVAEPAGAHVALKAVLFENAAFEGLPWDIRGTNSANTVDAQDTVGTVFHGFAGNDTFTGSGFDDTFNGGSGTDHSLGMGDGDDTCISVEIFDKNDCESIIG